MQNTMDFFIRIKNFLLESQVGMYAATKKAVIEFQSRLDGKRHKKPIQYIRSGNRLETLCKRSVQWWKNLKFGAPVDVIIEDEKVSGWAEAIDDSEIVLKIWDRMRSQLREKIDRAILSESADSASFGFNESDLRDLVLVTITLP